MGADNVDSRKSRIDASGSEAENKQLYAYKKIQIPANDLIGTPFETPSDFECRGIMVNVAGNVECKLFRDDTFDVLNLAASVIYPMRIKSIRGSGTAATGITLFG